MSQTTQTTQTTEDTQPENTQIAAEAKPKPKFKIKKPSQGWKSVFQTDDGSELLVMDFVDGLTSEEIAELWTAPLVEQPPITIMGKPARMRRNIGFFSDESEGYKYTGQISRASPLTPVMKKLLDKVNSICNNPDGNSNPAPNSVKFNGLLFNLYQNGEDYIGKHRDNETELTPIGVVALSLGVGRKFRLRNYSTNEILIDHVTGDNELMWMKGKNFHKTLTHEVPVEKKITQPRLSITFRSHTK